MQPPEPVNLEAERSVASIIAQALDLYQGYPLLFLTLASAVIVPYELAVLAVTGSGSLASHPHESAGATVLLFLLDFALVGPLVSALHVHAVVVIGGGDRPRLSEVARRGLRVLPVVAASVIVAGLGIGLGFIALIVPGVLLALRWSVVAQVAAVDQEGWLPSLRRSGELAAGHYRHIFGLLFVVGLLTAGVATGARGIPVGSGSGPPSVLLGIAVHTLTASFSALVAAILYFDLRARSAGTRETPAPEGQTPPDPAGT
jgi:hypothetical protein